MRSKNIDRLIAIVFLLSVSIFFMKTIPGDTEMTNDERGGNRGGNLKSPLEVYNEDEEEIFQYKGVSQDDPSLIEYIRKELLHPPSPLPYNLTKPKAKHFSQTGQSQRSESKYFHGMKNGFFIEVGAADGEFISNSLYFERELGWRGLLIEANPDIFDSLLTKHRKAYSINSALSLTKEAGTLNFRVQGKLGTGSKVIDEGGIVIKTIPLYSLLLALEVEVVDFFSLDIEGVEVKVLKTIPWDKIKFRLMCIEINHIPEGPEYLKEYLKEQGYEFLERVGIDMYFGWLPLLNETMNLKS